MRGTLAVLAVAALALTAGCGGLVGDGTETATTTTTAGAGETATTTAAATPTRTPIDASGFPAVDGTAVNETRLAQTHQRGLSNVSYTVAIDQRTGATRVTVDVRRSGERELLTTTINDTETPGETSETDYTEGSTEYIRSVAANGTVTYSNQTLSDPSRYTGEVVIDDFIDSAEHSPVAVTTYDGAEVVELTATRADIKPDALVENTTVDSFQSRLLVDREGRVRLFTYRISGVSDGEPYDYRLRFRLSAVGSTAVERPDWADRA